MEPFRRWCAGRPASNTPTTRMRSVAMLGVVALTVCAWVSASPATAEPGPGKPVPPPPSSSRGVDPAQHAERANVDPRAARAMAEKYKVSLAEATKRLGEQKGLGDRGSRLERSLAGRTGGSYLDAAGRLVVTTVDNDASEQVRRAGVRDQRVDDSTDRLEAIMRRFDQHAANYGAGSVQGWYVDVQQNSVVLTVTRGARDARSRAMVKLARGYGDSVRIAQALASEQPRTSAFLVGGEQYITSRGGYCSIGFNTRDSAGRNVVLTAGHCLAAGNNSKNGYVIGATRTANFPTDDFGTFWNSYPSYWQPSISVSKYNNTYVNVRGQWNNPPVGATVCKSGRTTGYTCGTITALNQTVTYTGGYTVSGLVRHNACVEEGDSGGANISSGAFALGVTSGASTPPTKLCLSKVGRPNVSWYQPIGEALSRNGLNLLYQP